MRKWKKTAWGTDSLRCAPLGSSGLAPLRSARYDPALVETDKQWIPVAANRSEERKHKQQKQTNTKENASRDDSMQKTRNGDPKDTWKQWKRNLNCFEATSQRKNNKQLHDFDDFRSRRWTWKTPNWYRKSPTNHRNSILNALPGTLKNRKAESCWDSSEKRPRSAALRSVRPGIGWDWQTVNSSSSE